MQPNRNQLYKTYTAIVLFAAVAVFLGSCRELYEPRLNVAERHMVVEALITDEAGPHIVRLSYTRQFGEASGRNPVYGARVYITDSKGNETHLGEKQEPGIFYTPDYFAGVINEIYTLTIEEADGSIYRSDPQRMTHPPVIDSIYAEYDERLFFYESESDGRLMPRETNGITVLMDVSVEGEELPRFRFETELYLQYEVLVTWSPPIYDFCWRTRYINDILYTDVGLDGGGPVSARNQSAFIPLVTTSMRFLGFPIYDGDRTISYTHPRVLNKTIYSLTEDAYQYHLARNQQLRDEGSLFDPIAPQLPTNIRKVNDTDEVVIGFFEVSSVLRETYNVRPLGHYDRIEIDKLECMHHIPGSGCVRADPPDWWI